MGGAHSRVEAYIASPTSSPYFGIQLKSPFHTQPLLTSLVYSNAPLIKCTFQLKPSRALEAPGHCHQLGLAYGHETWAYPTNTVLATVAFLLAASRHKLASTSSHCSLLTAT